MLPNSNVCSENCGNCCNFKRLLAPASSQSGDPHAILIAEGLADWTFEFSTGGTLCQSSQKRMLIRPDQGIAMFLHEVARAKVGVRDNDSTAHDAGWEGEYTSLVDS